MGQQSWLRLLDIEHHEVLPGTGASMAPGFGTAEELAAAKASKDCSGRRGDHLSLTGPRAAHAQLARP